MEDSNTITDLQERLSRLEAEIEALHNRQHQAQASKSNPAITIDQDAGTLTLRKGEDEPALIVRVSWLYDVLDWLIEREGDLRRMVYRDTPLPLRVAMHQEDQFMVGRCADRRLVKVPLSAWMRVFHDECEIEREARARRAEARREARKRPLLDNIEGAIGIQAFNPRMDVEIDSGQEVEVEVRTRMLEPAWWIMRRENLYFQTETFDKLP